jgi:hypothetical protein
MSNELIEAMRLWISDCSWPDLDPDDIPHLLPEEVVAGVRRHYQGGVAQFAADFLNETRVLP